MMVNEAVNKYLKQADRGFVTNEDAKPLPSRWYWYTILLLTMSEELRWKTSFENTRAGWYSKVSQQL
jgi:hypothetical protein